MMDLWDRLGGYTPPVQGGFTEAGIPISFGGSLVLPDGRNLSHYGSRASVTPIDGGDGSTYYINRRPEGNDKYDYERAIYKRDPTTGELVRQSDWEAYTDTPSSDAWADMAKFAAIAAAMYGGVGLLGAQTAAGQAAMGGAMGSDAFAGVGAGLGGGSSAAAGAALGGAEAGTLGGAEAAGLDSMLGSGPINSLMGTGEGMLAPTFGGSGGAFTFAPMAGADVGSMLGATSMLSTPQITPYSSAPIDPSTLAQPVSMGGAASGASGLLGSLADIGRIVAPIAGAVAGSQTQPGATSGSKTDPRIDPYIYGDQGLLKSLGNWYAQNKSGTNPTMQRGWDMQMGLLGDPSIMQRLTQLRDNSLLGTQVAGNGYANFYPGK